MARTACVLNRAGQKGVATGPVPQPVFAAKPQQQQGSTSTLPLPNPSRSPPQNSSKRGVASAPAWRPAARCGWAPWRPQRCWQRALGARRRRPAAAARRDSACRPTAAPPEPHQGSNVRQAAAARAWDRGCDTKRVRQQTCIPLADQGRGGGASSASEAWAQKRCRAHPHPRAELALRMRARACACTSNMHRTGHTCIHRAQAFSLPACGSEDVPHRKHRLPRCAAEGGSPHISSHTLQSRPPPSPIARSLASMHCRRLASSPPWPAPTLSSRETSSPRGCGAHSSRVSWLSSMVRPWWGGSKREAKGAGVNRTAHLRVLACMCASGVVRFL